MNAPVVTIPRHAHRRGTRGFAAFVTGLAGFVVLGVGAVVLPQSSLDGLALSWLIPLAVAFGITHLVAAYGLVRRRSWSRSMVGYLAAIGIGAAAYGLLITLTGLGSIRRDEPAPVGPGLGRRIWAPVVDDRSVAGGRSVRLQGHRADGVCGSTFRFRFGC